MPLQSSPIGPNYLPLPNPPASGNNPSQWDWNWNQWWDQQNGQMGIPSTPIGNGMETWQQQTQRQQTPTPIDSGTIGSDGNGSILGMDKEKLLGSVGSMASSWASGQRSAADARMQQERSGMNALLGAGEMTQNGLLARGERGQQGFSDAARSLGSPLSYGNELAQFALRRALTGAGGLQAGDPGVRGAMGNTSEIMKAAAPAYSVEREISTQVPYWSAIAGLTNGQGAMPDFRGMYGAKGSGAADQLEGVQGAARGRWEQEGAELKANQSQTRNDILQQLALAKSLGNGGGWLGNILGLIGGGLATYFGAKKE